jgi:magnesium-transporting ATPase (P-type)
MRVVEKIVLTVIILVIALKYFSIPGAAALLIVLLMTLSLFYMGLSVVLFNNVTLDDLNKGISKKGISRNRILGSVFTGFALSVIVIGVLFKIMLWQGSGANLLAGMLAIFIPLAVSIIKYSSLKDSFYLNVIKRTSVAIIVAVSFYLMPVEYLWNVYYKDAPEYIEALKKAKENPGDYELKEDVNTEREK